MPLTVTYFHRKPGLAIITLMLGVAVLAALPCLAQSSASYQVNGSSINCGGDPQNGVVLASPSFRVTLDAIGNTFAGRQLTSEDYVVCINLPQIVKPPTEVQGFSLTSTTAMSWNANATAYGYQVYRGLISDLPLSYGSCITPQEVFVTEVTDTEIPAPGQCFFYLVVARNILDEEGTLGTDSAGNERHAAVQCP